MFDILQFNSLLYYDLSYHEGSKPYKKQLYLKFQKRKNADKEVTHDEGKKRKKGKTPTSLDINLTAENMFVSSYRT